MPEKLDRCVADIKAKGEDDGVNPWAVCNASIGEAFIANNNYQNMPQEGGVGSGRKKGSRGEDIAKATMAANKAFESYDRPKIEKPYTPTITRNPQEGGSSGSVKKNELTANWGGGEAEPPYIRDGVKPLTNQMAESMIQEMKATPMTGATKRMSGGSKGKAPKHWTPVDFNVLDKAQGQKPVPPPVGRAIKEICEVCGVPGEMHENQDHPMIPPMPIENNIPPMPNGFPPTEPSPQIPSPQPQEQEPFPQPNGIMPPEQMPPEQILPPMPNSPQEQMQPLPSPMPTAPEPQMQMQYTVSIPNSLSAQSIGGKKVNEMIREIESIIK